MAFLPGLMTVDQTTPAAWALYGLCTLTRLCYYQAQGYAQRWARWAGATDWTLIPETPVICSSACVMTDGTGQAIVAWEGTRNIQQIVGNFVASAQTEQIPLRGNAHNFFQWVNLERLPAIAVALGSIPPGGNLCLTGHSLGGACANLQGKRWSYDSAYAINSCVTFGQPRTGDRTWEDTIFFPRVRVVNTNDPVPSVPPNTVVANAILGGLTLGNFTYQYEFLGSQFKLTPPTLTTEGTQPTTLQSSQALAAAMLDGSIFSAAPFIAHLLASYCAALAPIAIMQGGPVDLAPLVNLNELMDSVDGVTFTQPLPPVTVPSPGIFADPRAVVGRGHLNIEVPLTDVGEVVESRQMSLRLISPVVSGGVLSEANVAYTHAKVTWWFQAQNYGWSESLFMVQQGQKPSDNFAIALGLVTKLLGMCGSNTSCGYMRISMKTLPNNYPSPRPRRLSQLFSFPFIAGYAPAAPGGAKAFTDFPEVAIILSFTPSAAGFAPKLMYLRGIPDDFDVQGGTPGAATLVGYFGANWTNFYNQLVNGNWGWEGQSPTLSKLQQPITGLVQSTPAGAPSVTCASSPFATFNGIVPCRFSKLVTPGNLNGVHPLRVTSTTTAMFKQPTAMLPWDGVSGELSINVEDFTAVEDVEFTRLGERKCGAVFPRIRGRQRVRKLG